MTRIYGLDLWRSGLLLVGPLIHSTSPGYISDASSLFRMQVFFFIAGFLSAHASEKQADWTVRRYVQLGVPVITVWLFVLIPTKILVDFIDSTGGYSKYLFTSIFCVILSFSLLNLVFSPLIPTGCHVTNLATSPFERT